MSVITAQAPAPPRRGYPQERSGADLHQIEPEPESDRELVAARLS
jgi:hypothetical protein